MRRSGGAARLLAAIVAAIAVRAAGAQAPQPRPPAATNEARIDARFATNNSIEAGWGYSIPLGVYVRATAIGALGKASTDSGQLSSARVEVLSRFLLDPFRESRFGLSVGGGLGLTNSQGFATIDKLGMPHRQWEPYLALIADLELTKSAGWQPALQVGLGNGLRVGLLFRSSVDRWR
jgi:hypothetical protein